MEWLHQVSGKMLFSAILPVIDGTSVDLCASHSCWFLALSSQVLNKSPSPYAWWLVRFYFPVKGGIVHPYKNGFFEGSGKVVPIPILNVEVFQ